MSFVLINPYSFVLSAAPPSFPGLVSWWKADSMAFANNTAVGDGGSGGGGTNWPDSSGNGNVLFQTSAPARPTFKTNQFGSLPAVDFPGSPVLSMTNTLTLSGTFSAIVVIKPTNTDNLIMGNTTLNKQFRKGRSGVNNMSWYAGGSEVISTTLGSTTTALVMLAFRRSGSNAVTARENKTDRTSGSPTDTGSFILNQFGGSDGVTSPTRFVGLMCEAMIYNTLLSDANMDTLYDQYLKPKWGLP